MPETITPSVKRSVLVVEDHVNSRTLLHSILSRHFKVFIASDGLEALALLKVCLPDLIVTDILMPHLDGYELVMNLRKSGFYKHIPVFVISGCDILEVKSRLQREVSEIFPKPFNPEMLVSKINKALFDPNKIQITA